MSKALVRRSYLSALHKPGSGWSVHCPTCNEPRFTGSAGNCPVCRESLLKQVPAVPGPGSVAPFFFRRVPMLVLCVGLAVSPSFAISMAITGGSILGALLLTPIMFAALYFLSVPLAVAARTVFRRFHPVLKDGARLFTQQVEVQKAWFDITKLRGRRGLVLNFRVQASYLKGRRLQVLVRFRGPDGYYLRGDLRAYRGEVGEVLVRHATKPLSNTVALFERLWMFLPIRALGLPPGTQNVDLVAEVLVGEGHTVHAEYDLPIRFVPMAEDFPHLLGAQAGVVAGDGDGLEEGAVAFLTDTTASSENTCGVCGDNLHGEVVAVCSLCDSAHHQECWNYLGGCSTYACEGRPAEVD